MTLFSERNVVKWLLLRYRKVAILKYFLAQVIILLVLNLLFELQSYMTKLVVLQVMFQIINWLGTKNLTDASNT